MSAPFDNLPSTVTRAAGGASIACVLLLAACGGSTPSQPSAEAPIVIPSEAAEPAQAPPAGSRRARRRERDAEPVEAAEAEPVPEEVTIAYEQALAEMARENWIEAEVALEQLVAAHTEYPGPYVNLAIVYTQDGRDDEAREALEQALTLDPDHAVANTELGIVLRRAGEFASAEEAYRRAIAADPQYILAYYNLGVLLDLYLRRPEEALEYYELYQNSLGEPDQKVGRWIIDLKRRLGVTENVERVAQEDGQ